MELCSPYFKVKAIEYSVIVLLLALVILSMLMGISAITMIQGFGQNPIFKAEFVFTMRKPIDVDFPGGPLFPFFKQGNVEDEEEESTEESDTEPVQPPSDNKTATEPPKNETETSTEGEGGRFKRHAYKLGIGRIKQPVQPRTVQIGDKTYNYQDIVFLTTMMVDPVHSKWGPLSLRNYVVFYPFLMEIVALIIAALLITFRTGKEHYWGVSQPWIMVIPSIVVFAIMSLLSIAYWVVNDIIWDDLCEGIRSQLIDRNFNCPLVLLALQPIPPDIFAMDSSIYLFMFNSGAEISMSLWLSCLIIMTLRCIFAVDFQLIYVTVSMMPSRKVEAGKIKDIEPDAEKLEEEQNKEVKEERLDEEKTEGQATTQAVTDENQDQEVKMLSRERESEEDFHSAHSTLTTFVINEVEHPSLEPLLKNEYV